MTLGVPKFGSNDNENGAETDVSKIKKPVATAELNNTIEEIKDTMEEIRTKSGVLLVQNFQVVPHDESFGGGEPCLTINTTSKAERGYSGKGFVDLAVSVEEARDLLNTVKDALAYMNKHNEEQGSLNLEDKRSAEQTTLPEDAKSMEDLRNMTGMYTAKGRTFATFNDNYKNMGDKVLIHTMATGRKLKSEKGSVDMAFTPEQAQGLYDKLQDALKHFEVKAA